jgi:hypothetical protein
MNTAPRHENKILLLRLGMILGPIVLGMTVSRYVEGAPQWLTDLRAHWPELVMVVGTIVYGWDKAAYNKAMDSYDDEMRELLKK